MSDRAWPCAADARGLSAAFAQGLLQPTDLLAACLARIERYDAQLGVCNHRPDPLELLQVAKAADERWRSGAPLSSLDGVPFGVKANIAVRGQPWHGGIAAFRERQAAQDAACVARLRAAGMIPVAIFNMHEGALGATSDNPAFRTTRNPHNPAWIPGGSSGGSAAAVAAGMVPIALGTDSLGSVRLPSALCGVVGFKPAQNEICMDGVMPLSLRLDHVGVHARSLADVAMVMALLAPESARATPGSGAAVGERRNAGGKGAPERETQGGASRDGAEGSNHNGPQAGPPLRKLCWRLGPQLPFDQPIAQAFSELLRQRAVEDVLDWSDCDLSALRRAGLLICEREAAQHFAAALRERPDGFSETFRQMLAWGAAQPEQKAHAEERRLALAGQRLRQDLAGAVLLCPTTAHRPPKHGEPPATLADLTAPAAIAGLPAISTPLGMAPGGAPMGLQITALSSSDLLATAQRFFPDVAEIAP